MPYQRTFAQRVSDFLGGKISKIGEATNQDSLIYNPLTFWNFNRMAKYHAPAVIDSLTAAFPDARRFVDIGCGGGAYAAEFNRRDIDIKAIENSAYARKMAKKQGVECYEFDLLANPITPLDGEFDLAYCFEVAEHIPTPLSEKLVAFLTETADTIVFTAAQPGQLGMGHINCQPQAFWQSKFEQHGYHLDEEKTAELKQAFTDKKVIYWLTNNVTIYRKR